MSENTTTLLTQSTMLCNVQKVYCILNIFDRFGQTLFFLIVCGWNIKIFFYFKIQSKENIVSDMKKKLCHIFMFESFGHRVKCKYDKLWM